MSENITKHMHTVQRAYLEGFSILENNNYKIWRLDKTTGEVKKLPINKVVIENFFYYQEIEKWLEQEIETPGIIVIKKIIDNESVENLSQSDKIKVAKWIIVQDFRTREYNEKLKQFLNIQKELNPHEDRIEVNEELIKALQAYMMQSFVTHAPLIADYNWCLCINNSNLPLYCSDHPIIRNNSFAKTLEIFTGKKTFDRGEGYFSRGFEFNLPLTPKLLLLLIDTSPMWDFINQYPEKERYFLYQTSPSFKMLYKKTIEKCNELISYRHELFQMNIYYYNDRITSESYQYVFSKYNDFKMAKECLERIPESKNKERKRWDIKEL